MLHILKNPDLTQVCFLDVEQIEGAFFFSLNMNNWSVFGRGEYVHKRIQHLVFSEFYIRKL